MIAPDITSGRLTSSSLASAVAHLVRRDPALARIVESHGVPPLWARRAGFATLARIILEQQVSLAAARTVYERLANELPGGWTPGAILRAGTPGLTSRGLTRQKARYLVALAEQIDRGELVLPALARASDTEVHRQLTRVPGIGPWTASIYLLMALRRPDVWPPGDLALQKALAHLLGLERPLSSEEAAEFAWRWAPYRAVAARVLWHGYLARLRARSSHARLRARSSQARASARQAATRQAATRQAATRQAPMRQAGTRQASATYGGERT